MKVVWAELAQHNLEEIGEYISQGSPQSAVRLLERLRIAADKLARFPEIGRTGKLEGTRELVVPGTDYFIVYAIENQTVNVFAVIHGAQNWPG